MSSHMVSTPAVTAPSLPKASDAHVSWAGVGAYVGTAFVVPLLLIVAVCLVPPDATSPRLYLCWRLGLLVLMQGTLVCRFLAHTTPSSTVAHMAPCAAVLLLHAAVGGVLGYFHEDLHLPFPPVSFMLSFFLAALLSAIPVLLSKGYILPHRPLLLGALLCLQITYCIIFGEILNAYFNDAVRGIVCMCFPMGIMLFKLILARIT